MTNKREKKRVEKQKKGTARKPGGEGGTVKMFEKAQQKFWEKRGR